VLAGTARGLWPEQCVYRFSPKLLISRYLSSEQSGGIDTVLATAVGIHRLTEADVGRVVAGDDAARGFGAYFGAQARGEELFAFVDRPAVVHRLADGAFKAPGKVGRGTSALDRNTHCGRVRRGRLNGCDGRLKGSGRG